ncbi:hypothetical protein VTK56DRAFT_3462 [Thermocarpiscus australiensis]
MTLNSADSDKTPVVLAPYELSCGYCTVTDGAYTFVSEWTHYGTYQAKSNKRNLVLQLPGRNIEARISYQTIIEMVWSENGRIALILSWAPTFLFTPPDVSLDDLAGSLGSMSFRSRGGPFQQKAQQRVRVPAIDEQHAGVSNMCLVYYLSVPRTSIGRPGGGEFHAAMMRI